MKKINKGDAVVVFNNSHTHNTYPSYILNNNLDFVNHFVFGELPKEREWYYVVDIFDISCPKTTLYAISKSKKISPYMCNGIYLVNKDAFVEEEDENDDQR